MPINHDTIKTITLTTTQAELIENALAWHEIKSRDLSDMAFTNTELFEGDPEPQRMQDMKDFLADADTAFALRQQLVALFDMTHVYPRSNA